MFVTLQNVSCTRAKHSIYFNQKALGKEERQKCHQSVLVWEPLDVTEAT